MENRKPLTFMLTMVLIVTATSMACFGSDDDDGPTIMINGKEYTIDEIFTKFKDVTITSGDQQYTGISLGDLLNDTGLSSPGNDQYAIIAADGWTKNVTWTDVRMGILVKDQTMTAFPHLPGKYRVKDVIEIKKITTPTINVNGWVYTWDQPFDKFDEVIVEDNESNTYEGVMLSDLVNDTGLENPGDHNYTIIAGDEYSKEVTWDDMMNGILVFEDRKSVFPEKESKYRIKNIVEIEVV